MSVCVCVCVCMCVCVCVCVCSDQLPVYETLVIMTMPVYFRLCNSVWKSTRLADPGIVAWV